MMGRSIGMTSGLAVVFLVAVAGWSRADVTLVSQEARTGNGDWAIWPMNPTDPTYNWDHPTVWNTTTNFTMLDPAGEGLQLNMTRSGSTGKGIGPPAGSAHYGSWTIQDFKVVFSVDEPTPFAVESSGRWGQGIILPPIYHPGPVLRDGDGTFIFNAMRPDAPHLAMAGILQPGTYTFSGGVGAEVPREVSSLRLFESGGFTTQLIVGIPEPAVLPFLAAVLLAGCRRRH